MGKYLQYGCGLHAPEGWINFDASPTLWLRNVPLLGPLFLRFGIIPEWPSKIRYGDVISGLPIPENECDGIYCSHVLEHMALDDVPKVLANTYRALKPGGTFRFVLPDLKALSEQYLNDNNPDAAVKYIHSLNIGMKHRPEGLIRFLRSFLGHSRHLWMWDYESLKVELEKAGFKDVRRANFGDSEDRMFQLVEDPDRWKDALGIECRK